MNSACPELVVRVVRSFVLRLSVVLAAAAPGFGADTNPPPAETGSKPLDYMIVVTGEELLRGVYPDGHTVFITRTLHLLGCHCIGSMTVDDRPEDVKQALRFATQKAKLVVVTGGLGPTVNDVTRGALAEFTGIEVREHPEVLSEMERRFNTPRDKLRATLRRQTQVPVQGTYLKNPNGSAVGLVFEPAASVIVALPGPPRELQPMVQNELVPYLRRKFGVRPVGASLTLRFVGVGQSQIDQTMREHVPLPPDVLVSSLFEGGRVDFTFALPGNTAEDQARLKQIETKLREHLGDYFYADDGASLEEWVVKNLKARGGSLVLVEIGSGGRLAASLTGAREAAELLAGAFAAPTEERMRHLVGLRDKSQASGPSDEERLKELAQAALKQTGGQWAVAVGQVSPTGGGSRSVPVAFGFPDGRWEIQRVPVQGAGETAQAGFTTQVWDRLRRQLK